MTDRERIEGLIADLQNRIAPALRSQNAPGMARSVNEAAAELRRLAHMHLTAFRTRDTP